MRRFYLSLLPWVMFDVVLRSPRINVIWAAAVALATTSLVLALCSPRRFSILDVSAAIIFSGICLAALLDQGGDPFRRFVRVISVGALGVVALSSLLTTPCTSTYARERVGPRLTKTDAFRSINLRLTAYWSATFCAIAILNLIATQIHQEVAITAFNWFVPLGLVIFVGESTNAILERKFDLDGPTLNDVVEIFADIETLHASDQALHRPELYVYRDQASSS